MSGQKPTKEQEYALKDVLEDECLAWQGKGRSIRSRIRSACSGTKSLFQRIFRKNHLSDIDNWECVFCIVRDSLKRVKAFRAANRYGHPKVLGSMEEWNKILDEIILKLEFWIKFSENDGYELMCIEHGWDHPYAKKIEHKSVRYVFEAKDGSSIHTDDLDYDIKNPGYAYSCRQVVYYNVKAYEELQKKAEDGLLLFAKWLPSMFD
jgi:hypothetical protein